MQAPALVCVLAVVGLLAACGGEEEAGEGSAQSATQGEAGAGEEEPGAPDPGEPAYTGLGSWWVDLGTEARIASAVEFIGANPDDCAGVAAEDLERQTRIAYGLDFPRTATVSEVMLETCALIRDGE